MIKATHIKEVVENIRNGGDNGYSRYYMDPNEFYEEVIQAKGKVYLVSGCIGVGKTAHVLSIVNHALLENKKVVRH